MKTNVIVESTKDRNLYGVIIRQSTSDCMLSLTDLQEAYTRARVLNNWADRGKYQDIINQKENAERIYYLLKKQNFINSDFSEFMKMVETDGMVKILKDCKAYKTTGRGDNKQTSCNPYIWMLVAMELNPELYAEVIMWASDTLILNRIEAGNFYKELSAALYSLEENKAYVDFKRLAETLNVKIFGKHESNIRNRGSKDELERLYILEANIAYAINKGYLKTQEEVMKAITEY